MSLSLDNTNADPETRKHWTDLAKELSIPIRLIHFLSSPELCRHNAAVRAANKVLVCLIIFQKTGLEFSSLFLRGIIGYQIEMPSNI